MMNLLQFALALSLEFAAVATASGAVRLPKVFGDHMVLQSGLPLPVWGTAEPGEEISVTLAGELRSTTANSCGDWLVEFPPRNPSAKPITILIENTAEGENTAEEPHTITVRDVLVGEVWICAGQSNMEFALLNARDGPREVASSDFPAIRLLNLRGAAGGGSRVYDEKQIQQLQPETFCSGQWARCGPDSARSFSAVGYFFARMLRRELAVPIGVICPAMGGTPTEAWIRRAALQSDPPLAPIVQGNWLTNPLLSQWCRQRASLNLSRALDQGEVIPGDALGPNHCFKPSFLWQAAVKPLIPFAIRGVVWYQGESNAESPTDVELHKKLFPRLVRDWRQQWRQADFPVLFVQLPGMGRPAWPPFRESQRRFLNTLSNVGMAVTIDVGHPTDVHPTNKRPVGERLARLALGMTYGKKSPTACSGPLYQRLEVQNESLVLFFQHVGRGLVSNDKKPLRHFEIAGPDGQFHAARAVIDGDTVRVSSETVSRPIHARYAWVPFPDPPVNLFNRAGLPASPFSTESSP